MHPVTSTLSTRTWTRRKVGFELILPPVGESVVRVEVIDRMRDFLRRHPEHVLDENTLVIVRDELALDPRLPLGLTLHEAWAAGVPITSPSEPLARYRAHAYTAPFIDGKVLAIPPDRHSIQYIARERYEELA